MLPIAALCLLTLSATSQEPPDRSTPTPPAAQRGLVKTTDAATKGYTLYGPLRSTSVFLVDDAGKVAHEWKTDTAPGQMAYLLDNGHLLRCERVDNDTFFGGGEGGRVREYDWDGNVVWEYVCSDKAKRQHHDIEPMPNGHVLLIAWEMKSAEEAFDAGRALEGEASDGFWPDMVLEIEPTPPSGGKVVWEWHAWDHVIQDRFKAKPNFGDVAANPQLIDLNVDRPKQSDEEAAKEMEELRKLGYAGDAPPQGGGGPGGGPSRGADWLHTNSIDYSPELDLILLSSRSLSELWVIDHSTTTEQAKSHAGGRYGRGGDLVFRYGNPQNHRAGQAKDRTLFGQHDAQWISAGRPGAGHILVFNNGGGDERDSTSAVDELAVDLSLEGVKNGAKASRVWRYAETSFFSSHISGAQRLQSGNTLICSGEQGRVFEVTPKGEVVWDYLNPHGGDAPMGAPPGRGGPGGRGGPPMGPPDGRRGPPPGGMPPGGGPDGRRGPPGRGPGGDDARALFRAEHYSASFPGLAKLATPSEAK